MRRENTREKATRLLVEARVSVVHVDRAGVLAYVKGDSGLRRVTFDGSRWTCDCPALGPCSHAIATARVVVVTDTPWILRRSGPRRDMSAHGS